MRVFHELRGSQGFPAERAIRVRARTNTGAGRRVLLEPVEVPGLPDGYLDMGGRFIEMEGIPAGIMAVVAVEGGKLVEMELATYGEHSWDGVERAFSIGP